MEMNWQGHARTKNALFCPECDARVFDNLRGRFPCGECGTLLERPSDLCLVKLADGEVAAATRLHHREMLRSIERKPSPIRVSEGDGTITIKCDTHDCRSYVAPELLTRCKVVALINDPDNPTKKVPILVDRDLCPFCRVLSSRSGTQEVSPMTTPFQKSKGQDGRFRREDRRSAAEIDPATYAEMRKRYR